MFPADVCKSKALQRATWSQVTGSRSHSRGASISPTHEVSPEVFFEAVPAAGAQAANLNRCRVGPIIVLPSAPRCQAVGSRRVSWPRAVQGVKTGKTTVYPRRARYGLQLCGIRQLLDVLQSLRDSRQQPGGD